MSSPETPSGQGVRHVTTPPSGPKLYFNGFECTLTPADVIVTLKHDETPILSIYSSHIIAKTLVVKLGELLRLMEVDLGRDVLTTDDVLAVISKAHERNEQTRSPQDKPS